MMETRSKRALRLNGNTAERMMETRSKRALRINGNTASPSKKWMRPCVCCSTSSGTDDCKEVPKISPKIRKQKRSPRKKVNTPNKREKTDRKTHNKRVPTPTNIAPQISSGVLSHQSGTLEPHIEPLEQHSQRQHDDPPNLLICRSHSMPVSRGTVRDLSTDDADYDYHNCPDCQMISGRNAQHLGPLSSPPPPAVQLEMPGPAGPSESLAPPPAAASAASVSAPTVQLVRASISTPPAPLVVPASGTPWNFTPASGAGAVPPHFWPALRRIGRISFLLNSRPELQFTRVLTPLSDGIPRRGTTIIRATWNLTSQNASYY